MRLPVEIATRSRRSPNSCRNTLNGALAFFDGGGRYTTMMRVLVAWRSRVTSINSKVDGVLRGLILKVKKRKIAYFGRSHDKTKVARPIWEGRPTGMEINKRKAKNGLDDKHQRPDRNQIQRPCETGSRSGAIENHDRLSS